MKKGYNIFCKYSDKCKFILVANFEISNNVYNNCYNNYKELENEFKDISLNIIREVNIGIWKIKYKNELV